MTAGATLYLVSACGSVEEFVAAFRRYADRTGLFIPSAAPLPAGRRGRLALTLKDGGVMIEGEAEVVQSSVKPTVLYGRPGMTIKFTGPDAASKIVIGELEKARLAMKPVPPSVPPRPADVPAEPRPTVPPLGGRIDAANALAECVVIGDASSLQLAGGAPKPVTDAPSGKSPFLPQGVPALGGRPRSPSTPPEMSRPRTPSTPPDLGGRPRTPSTPPDPASKPLPQPSHVPASKLTSIGFPIIDKLPAATPAPVAQAPAKPTVVGPDSPLLKTTLGTAAPPNATRQMSSSMAPIIDEEATAIGLAPEIPVAAAKGNTSAPASLARAEVASETTEASSPPPPPAATEPAPPPGLLAPPPPPAPAPAQPPPRDPVAPLPSVSPSAKHKATSIGFPIVRTPFETQPIGVVPPPAGSEPAPPIVPKTVEPSPPAPRGKNPTRPPLMPRHPTPVAPVPIVRSPAKAAPHVEDEKTDISADIPAPQPAGATTTPETAVAAAAYTDAAKAADAAVTSEPSRSGGMRASEILRAIPTADWTMSPDASKPTVMPARGWTPIAGMPSVKEPPAETEPTPAPGTPPGPPTGDWTISLDPESPEAGWSEPSKVEKPAAPAAPAKPRHPTSGNPDIAVAGEKPLEAQSWDDKPTSLGEAKIEIDPTLMEPLTPMPSLDDDSAGPVAPPPEEEPSPFAAPAASPPPRAATEPLAGIASLGSPLRTPSGGTPIVGGSALPPPLVGNNPSGPVPLVGAPRSEAIAAATPLPPTPVPNMFGYAASSGAAVAASPARDRKRKLIVISAAVAAVAAGFVLVLLVAGGKKSAPNSNQTAGSAAAGSALVDEPTGSGDGSGDASAAVAVDVPRLDAGVEKPAPDTVASDASCKVTVTSVPAGAEILLGDENKGTTPGELELPCGAEAKLTLKKARFATAARSVTPNADKPNKLVVRLGRTMYRLKVTSSPAGATIKADGRSMGVTPATIRLPAYDTTAIVLSKPGYATTSKKVTPKSNNTSHHFSLKKKGKR